MLATTKSVSNPLSFDGFRHPKVDRLSSRIFVKRMKRRNCTSGEVLHALMSFLSTGTAKKYVRSCSVNSHVLEAFCSKSRVTFISSLRPELPVKAGFASRTRWPVQMNIEVASRGAMAKPPMAMWFRAEDKFREGAYRDSGN